MLAICFLTQEMTEIGYVSMNETSHASEEYGTGPIWEECVSVTCPSAAVFLSVPAIVGYEIVPFFEGYVNEIGHGVEQSETFPSLEGCGIWPS
ncbi:UNVERIFIED_CONTAM: hypothetical protein K2H54_039986 [Gekko kuhli]